LTIEQDNLKSRIREAITSQKRPTVTVLSSLLAIQDALRFIPDEAIEEVAISMNTSTNAVYGVASFYPNFRFTPPGDHSIEVCWGPTCHLQGAAKILESVMNKLGLESEGDTSDGKFSFRFNTCLGACSQAPVISVDHELFGKMDPTTSLNIIDQANSNKINH
jgi:NADH-quinone oxidoreductase subunit E